MHLRNDTRSQTREFSRLSGANFLNEKNCQHSWIQGLKWAGTRRNWVPEPPRIGSDRYGAPSGHNSCRNAVFWRCAAVSLHMLTGAQPLEWSGGPDPPNFAWTPPTFFMGGPILVGSAVRGKLRCVAMLIGAVTVAGYITLRCCIIMITWLTYLYVITTTT